MKKHQRRTLFVISVLAAVLVIVAVIGMMKQKTSVKPTADEQLEGTFETEVLNIAGEPKPEVPVGEEQESESDTGGDIFHISGYINGASEDAEQKICGISLPYQVQDTPIVIRGIGQYIGPFVEDGSDTPTANALALVIKNDSDTVVEYAELIFKVNDTEEAVFQISTIPPGKEAVVMEKSGRAYRSEDVFTLSEKLYAKCDELSLETEQVEVTAKGENLRVKNITGEDMETVLVRYKRKISEECYLGGITYSCKIENVTAGKSVEAKTQHFDAESSQVLMVEIIKNQE